LKGGRVYTAAGESPVDDIRVATLEAEVALRREECGRLEARVKVLEKELRHWRGRKLRIDEKPKTLREACDAWLAGYKGREAQETFMDAANRGETALLVPGKEWRLGIA
jgi:hypothetical protein